MCRRTGSLVTAAFVALAGLAPGAPLPKRPPRAISRVNAKEVRKITQLPRDVWDIVWGPKRSQVCFLGWERPVEVVDATTFEPVRKIGAGRRPIHFAVSADGDAVALCDNNTRVEFRNLRTDKAVVVDTGNAQPGMAFSPDGRLLATGGYGTQAKLWHARTGRLVRSLDAPREGGLTVAFSPDGKVLAVGNRNDVTRLYRVATGKLLHVLPRKMSHELKFSPSGGTLAVGYVDGGIALWDVADGTLVGAGRTGAEEVYTLDWSPAGDVLATAGLKGKISLWDARDLSILKDLEAPEWVIRVRFSPDGCRLLSAGGTGAPPADRKVAVWGVPSGGGK